MRRLLAAAATFLTGFLMPVTPAEAASNVSAQEQILYDGCRDYAYQIDGSDDTGLAVEWQYDITLYTPSGDYSDGAFESGSGSEFSQSGTFSVCDFEGVGEYTVEGTVTWLDESYTEVAVDDVATRIRFVRQPTASGLRVSDATPAFNSPVRFKMSSRQLTPDGWRANAYEYVALEANCGKGWYRVRGTKSLTDAYGRASVRLRYDTRRTCRSRTVTLATVNSSVSRSPVKYLNPH